MIKKDWNPVPSEKAPELEQAISAIFGINRKESIERKQCAICSSEVELDSFKDEISLKEFHISGMCQTCQDGIFS
jgi:hypothetical protein